MSKFDIETMDEIYTTKFKRIFSDKMLSNMSVEEKKQYYEDLRCYIKSLDYDKDKIELDEKHFLKAAKVIVSAFEFIYRPKAFNTKKDNKSEVGTIYVSNHLGSLDQFAVISAIGKDKPLHVLASSTLLKLKRGKLYKYAGCIFMDLKNAKNMLEGLTEFEKVLLDGRDVLIFPEGTRNTTDNFILEFLPGAIMASRDTGAKIVPFAVNENYKVFGDSLYVRRGEDFVDDLNDNTEQACKKLQEEIAKLIWENMELERQNNNLEQREQLIERHKRKQFAIEKQRRKINN